MPPADEINQIFEHPVFGARKIENGNKTTPANAGR